MKKKSNGGYIMERADHEKQLREFILRLTSAMDQLQIAMNILRTHYGVEFCNVRIDGSSQHRVQLYCGIEELAEVLEREVSLSAEWRAKKSFRYDWVEFLQLAENNSMNFLPLNYTGRAMYKLDDDFEPDDVEEGD